MNKKNIIIFLILLILVIGVSSFLLIFNKGKSTSITVSEKKWIEDNKNQVIDIAILNNLPYFGVNGEGIFFNFLADIEKELGLKFNKISYNINEVPLDSDFVFEIKPKSDDSEMTFFTDYYAIVGDKVIYSLDEMASTKVGVYKSDINLVNHYLKDVNVVSYDNYIDLFYAYKNKELNYIVVPYLPNIDTILENDYTISYRLIDIANKYILSSNTKEKVLNSIMNKYFMKWMNEKFVDSYKEQFTNVYFSNKSIDDQTKSSLLSKKYVYGYVNNLPYEDVLGEMVIGLNKQYLNNFTSLTDVEFIYKKFNNFKDLEKALAEGKIDIAFGYFSTKSKEISKTNSLYDNKLVILSNENDITLDSVKSLNDYKVMSINDTLINSVLESEKNIDIKKYSTLKDLLKSKKSNSLIALDSITYNYYKDSSLNKFNVILEEDLDNNYTYYINNSPKNKVFKDVFSHYINTVNKNTYYNRGLNTLLLDKTSNTILKLVIDYIIYVLIAIVSIFYISVKLFTKKKEKKQIKKEDKLKFVDMLTSLKNRNYLNYNMEKWDNNDVYPQSIVIIDLNNVKYINDNFGHEEGDNVIVSAANTLINSQLDNSDIIRTDGNEFLVYLVGYKEEEVISYIRKLNREFKNLTHGFGAAVGYSIIKDGITTIDDAINEATLDMRTNKESLQD